MIIRFKIQYRYKMHLNKDEEPFTWKHILWLNMLDRRLKISVLYANISYYNACIVIACKNSAFFIAIKSFVTYDRHTVSRGALTHTKFMLFHLPGPHLFFGGEDKFTSCFATTHRPFLGCYDLGKIVLFSESFDTRFLFLFIEKIGEDFIKGILEVV